MLSPITLKEAAELLNYKDKRSVVKWCNNNGVETFVAEGTNRSYMVRMQFEYARLKDFIRQLKSKHGHKWFDAFRAHMTMDITTIVEMEETDDINISCQSQSYQPSGNIEKQVLSRLQKNKTEL